MTKTANKRQKVQMPQGIRNKLMVAVSMLLVSSIMVVSSTYAWFTLSTAPEVTGITTNIGANGNLEMMLLNGSSYNSSADDLGVTSQVGDSMSNQSVTAANQTWGNLVDLSDTSYGLGSIVLSPARLNLTNQTTLNPNVLLTPSYGTDGRVIDISTAAYFGKYDSNVFKYATDAYGVRALGTTTAVSQRVASYRSAKAAVTLAKNDAKNAAAQSLLDNGQTLANIMVAYVQNPNTTYTYGDLRAMESVLTALETANGNAFKAIKQTYLANTLSAANAEELTDEEVTALVTAVEAATTIDALGAVSGIVPPANAADAVATYTATLSAISTAKSNLYNVASAEDLADDTTYPDTAGTFTYDNISPVLNGLVDKEHTEIAGIAGPGHDDLNAIIDYFVRNQKIDITMLNGSGVYANIATMVGNYTASGLTVSVVYSGNTISAPVTMNTQVAPADQIGSITIGGAPASSGQVANAVLNDTFGYMLDFGFRTNAAASQLQLQTSAANRVYSDQNDPTLNTQGAGSFMEFTSTNINTFSKEEVLALMSAIRIAFVTPAEADTFTVLAMGALNITSTWNESAGVTTYTAGEGSTELTNGYKVPIYLYNYTRAEDGTITLGAKRTDSDITALEQNVAKKISVIVYLDGDLVDNTMVANNQTSMVGKLNLQFGSSATLSPMENTGLRDGGTTGATLTYSQVATAGQTYTQGTVTGTVKTGFTIYKGSDNKFYFSTDGSTYTHLTAQNATTVLDIVTP